MRSLLLVAVVGAGGACSFHHGSPAGSGDGGVVEPDAPPVLSAVRFISVTASVGELRPGRYGITVEAVLHNGLDVAIDDVAATLSFGGREADFRWRDADRRDGVAAPQPMQVAAGADATYRFVVDALAWAAPPGPVEIAGAATFRLGAEVRSAAALDPAFMLPFATLAAPIVVTTAADEVSANGMTSLREALVLAQQPGFDRIIFDPSTFSAASPTTIQLLESLGALPTITGDLVIDGHGAGVTLAIDSTWEVTEGRYGLRLTTGTLVIAGLGFENFAFNHRDEGDLSTNNCGGGAMLEGGAIRVDGGTLVLDGNRFADPAVSERNCYAASLRLHGGTGHRIVRNEWTDQVMDTIYVDNARVIEISDNVMNAGADLSKTDECIYINSQGGQDLWLVGNVCADMEYSAVYAGGTDPGTLYVVHNTFVRNGRVALSGLRRGGGQRAIVLRNNVYVGNNPAAIQVDSGGTGFDLAFEAYTGTLCTGCASAMIDGPSMLVLTDPMVVNGAGATRADFTPVASSPLVDSGTDWVDRNGSVPGRYNGAGPERGAIERPP
jgi:hypothetical protein